MTTETHHQTRSRRTPLGFNGEYLESTGGHYLLGNGYRPYSPVLMYFFQPDEWSPFGAGGFNPYAYCKGDPVNLVDPTGHVPVLPGMWHRRSSPYPAPTIIFAPGVTTRRSSAVAAQDLSWQGDVRPPVRPGTLRPGTSPAGPLDLTMPKMPKAPDAVMGVSPPAAPPQPLRRSNRRGWKKPPVFSPSEEAELIKAIKARNAGEFNRIVVDGKKKSALITLNKFMPMRARRLNGLKPHLPFQASDLNVLQIHARLPPLSLNDSRLATFLDEIQHHVRKST